MKDCLKKFAEVFAIACFSMLVLASCTQKSKLKVIIAAANARCPVSLGTLGEVVSITFDGNDMVYTISADEDFCDLDLMRQNADVVKKEIASEFATTDADELLEQIIQAKAGLKYVYIGKSSGDRVECCLTTSDLEDIKSGKFDEDEIALESLREQARQTNQSCPMKIDDGIVLNSVFLDESNFVYLYTVDTDIADLEEQKDAVKQGMKEELNPSDLTLKALVQLCVKCDKGFLYRYTDGVSEDKVDIVFGVDELKEMFDIQ